MIQTEISKRELIINATLKLTAEQGFLGTSTAAIAKEAQVGMGTIYRHFENKEQLLSSIFYELRDKLIDLILSTFSWDYQPYDNFCNITSKMISYYNANQSEFKYLERYADSSLAMDESIEKTALLLEPVRYLLNNDVYNVKFKPYPISILFAMIYGPLIAIVNLSHMGRIELTDDLINNITKSCWDSILDHTDK